MLQRKPTPALFEALEQRRLLSADPMNAELQSATDSASGVDYSLKTERSQVTPIPTKASDVDNRDYLVWRRTTS